MVRLRVRQVAEAQGYKTPGALARESRVSYATIHRLWNEPEKDGNLTVDVLARLAQTLKVGVNELVDASGNTKPARMSA